MSTYPTYTISRAQNGWIVSNSEELHRGVVFNPHVFNDFKDAAKFLKDNLKLEKQ